MKICISTFAQTLLGILLAAAASIPAHAQAGVKFKIVHAFGALPDGFGPVAKVVFDSTGNLYGTTAGGGEYNKGTVYELNPGGGGWTETILHSFEGPPSDGIYVDAPVSIGMGGTLYGTTEGGGAFGYGTVYSVSLVGGQWSETLLHSFALHEPVGAPYRGVVQGKTGNLYGTAAGGIYELVPNGSGWALNVLCTQGVCKNAGTGQVSIASGGQLYGSAGGGKYLVGAVYALVPTSGGWRSVDLYDFGGFPADGQIPTHGSLALDAHGNLYGTTGYGGSNTCGDAGCGTIFRLTPGTNGQWTETILYNFRPPSSKTGYLPAAGVILDKTGNLYGSTSFGGATGCGEVYRLAPGKNGVWVYTVLHDFDCTDGGEPNGNLTFDAHGNLFGTAFSGGLKNRGVVFEISRQ